MIALRIIPVFLLIGVSAQAAERLRHASQEELSSLSDWGLGFSVGTSIFDYKGDHDGEPLGASLNINMGVDYRVDPLFGLGLHVSRVQYGQNLNYLDEISFFEQSLTTWSTGLDFNFMPWRTGVYLGARVDLNFHSFSWQASSLIPGYESQSRSLSAGPQVGFDYFLDPQFSLGGAANYLFFPEMVLDDRYEGNLVSLPAHQTLNILFTAKTWF